MSDYEKMIAVTNRKLCKGDYLKQIRKVASVKPKGMILREKDLQMEEYEVLAKEVLEICLEFAVPCWIHSFSELLEKLDTPYLHVSVPGLRRLKEEHPEILKRAKLSVSCHSMEDALEAQEAGAVQILLGNIFETDCKKGLPGKGLEFLQEVCSNVSVPVYGIGGISEENLPLLLEAGAKGGCMMSGFMKL